MGCYQSNPSPQSNDGRKFIDPIKQSSLDSGQKSHMINNSPQLQKIVQYSQSYQYSKHGLNSEELMEDSRVSIFEQQRKKLQQRSNRRLHMDIHPQGVSNNNQNDIWRLQIEQKRQEQDKKNIKKEIVFPQSQQFMLSKLGLNQSGLRNEVLQQEESDLFEQSVNGSRIMKNKQEELNNDQTQRQLLELHAELNTMIVMWEKLGNRTKRLKLQTLNTNRKRFDINGNGQKQVTNRDNSQQKVVGDRVQNDLLQSQSQTDVIINQRCQNGQVNDQQRIGIDDEKQIDKQLQEIWNQQNQNQSLQIKQNQPQHQPNQQQSFLSKHQKNHLPNVNIQQKTTNPLHHETTTPLNRNASNSSFTINQDQSPIKMHLSKINPQISNQDLSNKSSEHPSQQIQSKCLLSNPTKILNDSLIDQFNQEKEIFYFKSQNHQHTVYPKWVQIDRKAYQLKTQDFLSLFSPKNHHFSNQQIRTKKVFISLLCVIKAFRQLNRVNLIAFRTLSSTSILLQAQAVKQTKKTGFRIFYNGIKRVYPFQQGFDGSDLFLQLWKMFLKLFKGEKSSCELLYNMTGWIPERIMVNEVTNHEGVFQRLNNNFVEGNTIITFTGRKMEIWGLKSIDINKKLIHLYGEYRKQQKSYYSTLQQFQQTYSWEDFINMIAEIDVNWNPSIYDYVWRSENVFYLGRDSLNKKDSIGKIDQQYVQSFSHQYLLKIPPSQEDIQVRLFIEVHYASQNQNQSNQNEPNSEENEGQLLIELHDYSGTRINSSALAIRTIQKNNKVFSDVLIFESSQQRTQYVLLVRPYKYNQNRQIKYTISTYTFVEVSLQQIPATRVIEQKIIKSYLQQSHCGYGINSPHFLNNFYMQVRIPPLQRVKIFVSMPIQQCRFELNLIANPYGEQNLTRLNLQNILGDIISSQEFEQGKGYIEIETKYEEYFFMITNHTKCKGDFTIIIQIVQKIPRYLTMKKLQQIQAFIQIHDKDFPTLIYTKEKFFYQQPVLNKQFSWLPTHTGPRKRLKSNTHGGYQPFGAFKEFFKNPFIDYRVDRFKKLQFSIYSKSYLQYFDALQNEDKPEAQPPTISLAILKVKRPNEIETSSYKKINITNQSLFKIILDDAFYVPFGFGFWTKVIQMQEGQYRFIFPKMEKQSATGVFSVYEITN